MKKLTFRERDSVPIDREGGLSLEEAKEIQGVADRLDIALSSLNSSCLRFGQYCGIVEASGLIVELLPKIDPIIHSTKESQGILVSMLSQVGELDVKFSDYDLLKSPDIHLLDIFIDDFCNKVNTTLRKISPGVETEKREGVLFLRGRINLVKQSRAGLQGGYETPCIFDDQDIDSDHNRVIKSMLHVLLRHTENISTRKNISTLLNSFHAVSEKHFSSNEINSLRFSKETGIWKPIFERASAFLRGYNGNLNSRSSTGLTLLFNMEKLFENVVGLCIKKRCHDSSNGYLVANVPGTRKCLSERAFRLKPDITIHYASCVIMIIDVKWKKVGGSGSSVGVKSPDVYQATAYASSYACGLVSLVFPSSSLAPPGIVEQYKLETSEAPTIKIISIDIISLSRSGNVGACLDSIIGKFRDLYSRVPKHP